jgi:hypothetical protein
VLESIPHDISRLHRREWRRARLEEANSLPKWRSTSHFIQWMILSPSEARGLSHVHLCIVAN